MKELNVLKIQEIKHILLDSFSILFYLGA